MLTRHDVKPIVFQRKKKDFIRYQRPIPGDRVQMDTCKIAPGIYQYTAIDDCSRYRVLDVFNRRSAANTLIFIDKVIEEMPFPIQRIQTDRGTEFFAEKVQRKLMVSIGTLIDPPICGVLDPLKTVFFVLKQSDYFLLCAPRPV